MQKQIILVPAIAIALAIPIGALGQTLDLPSRKSGLWEITTTWEKPPGMLPMTVQMCVDSATDRDLMGADLGLMGADLGLVGVKCKSITTRREGQSHVIETDCAFGPIAGKTKAVIAGDFSSAYTTSMESTIEGSTSVFATQSTGKWMGANCPGMKPGDITAFGSLMANVNVLKLLLDPSARPAAQLPPRRAGQWEVRITQEMPGLPGLPGTVPPLTLPPSQMCIDAATDRETMETGLMPMPFGGCAGNRFKRVGSEWVLDDGCEFGDMKMATKTAISGDFQSMITLRIEQTMEGLPGSTPLTTIETRTARWMGSACTDGMVPGDIVMSDGLKLNGAPLAELEKRLGQMSKEEAVRTAEELYKSLPQFLKMAEEFAKGMGELQKSLPPTGKKP